MGSLSHLGDLLFHQKPAQDMMHKWAHCREEPADHRLPIAEAFWISFCRGMFKANAKLDAYSLLYSVILNVIATQYTCSFNGIYRPHWLVQWRHFLLFMHSHSSPLSLAARLHQCCANCSCYINNGWTCSGQTSYILIWVMFLISLYLINLPNNTVCFIRLHDHSKPHWSFLRLL